MSPLYDVIVENVGIVITTYSKQEAWDIYEEYVEASKTGRGRAGKERVTMLKDGEPFREFDPTCPPYLRLIRGGKRDASRAAKLRTRKRLVQPRRDLASRREAAFQRAGQNPMATSYHAPGKLVGTPLRRKMREHFRRWGNVHHATKHLGQSSWEKDIYSHTKDGRVALKRHYHDTYAYPYRKDGSQTRIRGVLQRRDAERAMFTVYLSYEWWSPSDWKKGYSSTKEDVIYRKRMGIRKVVSQLQSGGPWHLSKKGSRPGKEMYFQDGEIRYSEKSRGWTHRGLNVLGDRNALRALTAYLKKHHPELLRQRRRT